MVFWLGLECGSGSAPNKWDRCYANAGTVWASLGTAGRWTEEASEPCCASYSKALAFKFPVGDLPYDQARKLGKHCLESLVNCWYS